MFDSGDFDGTKFTAPVDGIYSVAAAQRFDEAGGDYFRLEIVKNPEADEDKATEIGYRSGIHTIQYVLFV